MNAESINSLRRHSVNGELAELRRIFSLKALAKLTEINYNTLLDHSYARRSAMRDYGGVLKITRLYSECKQRGWI